MKLIIVRHGETEGNVNQTMQGHLHGKLTEKGVFQATKLAELLKNERIDAIFSSDLERARGTASEIGRHHSCPVYFLPELRERKVGIYEGRHYSELKQAVSESGKHKVDFIPEGGESFGQLKERASVFFDRLLKEFKGRTVLVCSHGGFNRMLLGILLGKPIEEAVEIPQNNACINIVEISEDKKHHASLLNSIDHL
ncbi:histidine phosphatase family protein [Candidatus Woesearchaeota archaeon]|nr:histidine phosphatase family protein [Candidatus Woesearchaeota archaeon]